MRSDILIALGGVLLLQANAQTAYVPNSLYGCEQSQGFFTLFDSTREDFNARWVQWRSGNSTNTDLNTNWKLDTATSSMSKITTSAGDIRTRAQFADFDVRFQYKTSGNAGFLYRGRVTGGYPWSTAVEFAIDNNTSQTTVKYTNGAAYDIYAPVPTAAQTYIAYSASSAWNEGRIVAIGDSVEHWTNGVKVVGYRFFSDDYNTRYAASKWGAGKEMGYAVAGNQSAGPILRGYLSIQGDHPGNSYFRSIRIDTTPSWTTTYQYPDTTGCPVPVRGSGKIQEKARVLFFANTAVLSHPGQAIRKAFITDLSGRKRLTARINGQGQAEFAGLPENGLYFLSYEAGTEKGSQRFLRTAGITLR